MKNVNCNLLVNSKSCLIKLIIGIKNMSNIYIVGVGMIKFGWYIECILESLIGEVIEKVFVDVGCDKDEIGMVFFIGCI